ncbi:hypothetical protein Tco_1399701 [Tanacetum coccineum]
MIMPKNVDKKSGKRQSEVGILKKYGINTNFPNGHFVYCLIRTRQLRMNIFGYTKVMAKNVKTFLRSVPTHSESGTPSRRRDLRKRLGSRRIRSTSGSPAPRHSRSESPRKRDPKRKTMFKSLEKGVFHRLGDKGKSISTHSNDSRRQSYHSRRKRCQKVKPWVYKETDPFTPSIRYFDLPKRTHIPSHVKTYDGSGDREDHLKIFQAAAKVESWAMPTWYHMFNSTLIGSARVWFDDLSPESVDSYDDLKGAFLENIRQQEKCVKIIWKSTISSKEKENLWRILCVDSRLKAGM